MFTKFLLFVIVGLAVPYSTLAQNCPPAELLAPCECDETILKLTCSGLNRPDFDLKSIFERVSPLVGEDVVFTDLVITYLPESYTKFPANTIPDLKFRRILFEKNQFSYIHPDAFNATYDVTTRLSLFDNGLTNGTEMFQFVNRFSNLEDLSLSEWYVRDIPSDPLRPMPNLQMLSYSLWGLERVGSRIFANLPSLSYAQVVVKYMSTEGYALDAFEGITPGCQLRLDKNPMSTMQQELFKPVVDAVRKVVVGGVDCWGIGLCDNRRFACDEKVAWLCDNVQLYEPKLEGYYCITGLNFDVFDWCRRRGNGSG